MKDPKKDPSRETRKQVIVMRKAGVPVLRIAVALDISTQRVYEILRAEKEAGRYW